MTVRQATTMTRLFFRERSRLPFIKRQLGGKTIKILIDTGAAKNYVNPVKELKNVVPVEKLFTVSSIHGSSEVKQKCLMNKFGQVSPFFMLDTLTSFDAIIGFDLLTGAGVALNLQESTLCYKDKSEQIQYHNCEGVNFTDVDDIKLC